NRTLIRINAADQNHVASAAFKFTGGDIERCERRGAGGIDRVIHPTQIESVGYAARSHTHQGPGKGIGSPFRELRHNLRSFLFKKIWQPRPEGVFLAQIRGPAASAQNDCRPLPRKRAVEISGVFQGIASDFEREQVYWLN